MIARNFCIPAIADAGAEDAHPGIYVGPVEPEDGKRGGPGGSPLTAERGRVAERRPEQTSNGTRNRHPHVEITANDERGSEGGVPQEIGREQHRCLLAALAAGKTPVQVEEMEALAVRQRQIGTQASARLAAPDGEVVVLRPGDWKPRNDGVAVGPSRAHQGRTVSHRPAEEPAQMGGVVGHFAGPIGRARAGAVRIAYFL